MNDFSRNLEQPMAQRPKGHPLTALGQAAPLEPVTQVPGQLRDQQPSPVRVVFLARHLLKTKIVLVLLNPVLHPATLERPFHQPLWPSAMIVGNDDVLAPTLNPLLVFDLRAVDPIAVWRAMIGPLPQLSHLLAVAGTRPAFFGPAGDLVHPPLCPIGSDPIEDWSWLKSLTKLDQVPNVKLALGAQGQRQSLRRGRNRLLEEPERLGPRRLVARQPMRP